MEFEKKSAAEIRYKWFGHFRIKELEPRDDISRLSDLEIISSLIESPFHFNDEEANPNGSTIYSSFTDVDKKTTTEGIVENVKYYGFFENYQLSVNDYKKIKYSTFREILSQSVFEMTEETDSEFKTNIIDTIDGYRDNFLSIYHLALTQESAAERLSKFSPYDEFEAFIAINKEDNKVWVIEFGST
jgi:hypothetical protein